MCILYFSGNTCQHLDTQYFKCLLTIVGLVHIEYTQINKICYLISIVDEYIFIIRKVVFIRFIGELFCTCLQILVRPEGIKALCYRFFFALLFCLFLLLAAWTLAVSVL